MAITSYDSLINAMIRNPRAYGKDAGTAEAAGISHTPWYGTGIIGAGAAPGGGLNGATFSGPALAGQIPMPAAVAGVTTYLARWSAVHAGNIGHLWLIDRQWGNVPVVTTLTPQAVTSPTWVARDESASTNGAGVLLALETSAAAGNGAPITNTTVSYTNSAGTAGRTATMASYPATPVQGTFVPFALQAGDQGVRSVQSITLGTSYVSGQVNLIAYRLIAELELPNVNVGNKSSFAQLNLPAIWDASVLQLVYWPVGTALGALAGSLSFAQG